MYLVWIYKVEFKQRILYKEEEERIQVSILAINQLLIEKLLISAGNIHFYPFRIL
ncbi:hypothetical protein SAMN05216383_12224 [Prevotella sp. KH2C16]|nr:hypothetical protein SAMN05216383_12224 [Prevotella sp. KH2C16]